MRPRLSSTQSNSHKQSPIRTDGAFHIAVRTVISGQSPNIKLRFSPLFSIFSADSEYLDVIRLRFWGSLMSQNFLSAKQSVFFTESGIFKLLKAQLQLVGDTQSPDRRSGFSDCRKTYISENSVGAIIDRPPKNAVFRIFRRKIGVFSPCGDRFCLGKICGRSMIAPTISFFDKLKAPTVGRGFCFASLRTGDQA